MPKKSKRDQKSSAITIYKKLREAHPDAHCALIHQNPFELAVAVILSAQCTDVRVNQVTPELFKRFPTSEALAIASQTDVEDLIRPTGFFRNKAKSLIGMARGLVEKYGGNLPKTMEELVKLPGIGRKTANVILGNAFDKNEGVVVDTHIKRLSKRLGLTKKEIPEQVEQDLMRLFPRETWTNLAHTLIFHGRRVCHARKPKCGQCIVADLCPSAEI